MQPEAIQIRVRSYGPWRAVFAEGGETLAVRRGTTVGDLVSSLVASGRLDEASARAAAVAVGPEYASADRVLLQDDEIALLPPVSGGSEAGTEPIALVSAPIDAAAWQRQTRADADGAVCVFDGVVRDNTRGRRTLHLEYEAFDEMALVQMRALRLEAMARFGVREVAIVHRLGRLLVGETSVLIVVGSAHRGPAFEACRWVIDTLKKTVPIWKREQFADGAVWADGEPFPEDLALDKTLGS